VFGTALALHWRVPLVPARKFGKLPGRTVRQTYALEYGEDTLEMHDDALVAGQRVAVVDDLLATGGTAAAAIALVEQLGATVSAVLFVIELDGLGGRERLAGRPVHALLRAAVA
jgi:adenine phosphoribosyltransferase